MWSDPFFRSSKATNGEKIAVLLMDTQGMFDNETTMTLTAQIFGLSTLVSSFQIYNVDKRIQEDNLQHLALFSEYGRMALLPENEMEEAKSSLGEKLTSGAATAAASATTGEETPTTVDDKDADLSGADTPTASRQSSHAMLSRAASRRAMRLQEKQSKPFQRLMFLVRDWQNFDKEYNAGDSHYAFMELHEEMQNYLAEVLRSRSLADLKSTREQIARCFDKLDCFLLPHPGFAVVKKNFDGSIEKIDPTFRALVNKFVRFVFDEELEAKLINQHPMTAPELCTYFEVYVKMFRNSDSAFPKAMTMLDATAEANNRNAFDLAMQQYKQALEEVAGKDKPFIKETELRQLHKRVYQEALDIFDMRATMGANDIIEKMRDMLIEQIEGEKIRYFTTNALRNPFKDLEFYLLPLAIAIIAWIMSILTDITCSTDFCEQVEDTFVNIYFYVLFLLIVLGWNHILLAVKYLKAIAPELVDHIQQNTAKKNS
jgi:atlastin